MSDRDFIETKIDGETIFSGRILTLEVDRVRLPDGGRSVREVIRHPGASVMVPAMGDGTVLFVRQFRYATGGMLLELPAGKLDPGEDPAACAERETAEETGLRPRRVEKLGEFFTAPGFSDELVRVYLVTDLRPAPEAEADADEQVELIRLSADDYHDLVDRGEIRDAKTLAAMALWERKSGRG